MSIDGRTDTGRRVPAGMVESGSGARYVAKDWIAQAGSVSSFVSHVGQEPVGGRRVQRELRDQARGGSGVVGPERDAPMSEAFTVDRRHPVW